MDAIYASVGLVATYRLANGVESSVTVIPPWIDEQENLGYGALAPDRARFMAVRISEIATPGRGDLITIGTGVLAVSWSVDAVESNDGIEAVLVVH